MAQGIDIGGIYADLDIRTGNLDKGLAAGRKAMQAIDRELDQLDNDLRHHTISVKDHDDRLDALVKTYGELNTKMKAAYGATRTLHTGLELVSQNANAANSASGRMGQGLMQLGYAVDDLQYGISGVLNNVAPLASGIGAALGMTATASAGFATGAQVAAVAAYQLYTNWDLVMEMMGSPVLRTETEEMEKLAKATKLTADEQERLNRYKREQKVGDDLDTKQSESVEKTQKAVEHAISELGDDHQTGRTKLINGLIAARRARGEGAVMTDEEKNKSKVLERDYGGTAYAHEYEDRVRKRLYEEDRERARNTVDEAAIDPVMQQVLTDEIAKNPKMFPKGALEDFQNIKPEKTKEEKKAAAASDKKNAARQKAIGRMAFLQEESAFGLTPEEETELERLESEAKEKKARETRQKADAKSAARQRAVGRKAFLEEESFFGLTPEEQTELDRLQSEAKEKESREAIQQHRALVRFGKEAAPGDIKDKASIAVMQEAAGMVAPGSALERIKAELKRNGATEGQADAAGREIATDARKDMEKGITDRMLDQKQKQSQVFDATSLAAQFQSSVGGDETKKQTGLLEKLEKTVDMLAKQGKLVKIK